MTTMLTAEQAARALVAACKITGVSPEKVFDKSTGGAYGARIVAAMGARSRFGLAAKGLARVFRVAPADLTPSAGARRRITANHLLIVAEAMTGGVMPDAEEGSDLDLEPDPPGPSRPAPRRDPPKVHVVTNPVRAAAPVAAAARAAAMKAVTADIQRWAAAYVQRGVRVAYLADLFDVDAEALKRALSGSGYQRAA